MNHHEGREEHEGRGIDALSRQVIGCAIEDGEVGDAGMRERIYGKYLDLEGAPVFPEDCDGVRLERD